MKKGYDTINKQLESCDIYSKEEFLYMCKKLNILQFCGKSGNRKLIKYDIKLYKSLLHYTEFLQKYSKNIWFVLRLKVAANNLILSDHMLCKCKSQVSFDKQTQDFTKSFCEKCKVPSMSLKWWEHRYGNMWIEAFRAHYAEYFHKHASGMLVNIGKYEKDILNFIEIKNKIKLVRAYKIGPYYCDGYCIETNTVFEVYEQHHKYGKQKLYDITRQQHIQDTLQCNFVIIHCNTKQPLDTSTLIIENHKYV